MKFASLCILAYKRPEMLQQCLDSLHATIDFPCEIIINVDGINTLPNAVIDVEQMQTTMTTLGKNTASKIISVHGFNRGVGRSFQNCIGVAEGDYIFKLDTDLIFKPHWLSTAVGILEDNPDVGAISLFDYRQYDPKDERFKVLEERNDCFIVNDFVSSSYGVKSENLHAALQKGIISNIPDDGLHQAIAENLRMKLAITIDDFVENVGFGLGKSVYVVPDAQGNPVKAETHDTPKLFGI